MVEHCCTCHCIWYRTSVPIRTRPCSLTTIIVILLMYSDGDKGGMMKLLLAMPLMVILSHLIAIAIVDSYLSYFVSKQS
jgi:hypothetical protein